MTATAKRPEIRIGPSDHGRRMSLDDFAEADADGRVCELNKGVVEIHDVPNIDHGLRVLELCSQLVKYKRSRPGIIEYMGGGSEAKLLVGSYQSERHPDWSIYLLPEPDEEDVWSYWVPTIVVEIVSESSVTRDYHEKPPEYLDFGVREYWIIDPMRDRMTVLSRWRGFWRPSVVRGSQNYSTWFLPDFSLDLRRVLAAGKRRSGH